VLLLVNTLLSDLKSDNFVIVASALVVTTKLIGPDLINAGEVQQQQQGQAGWGKTAGVMKPVAAMVPTTCSICANGNCSLLMSSMQSCLFSLLLAHAVV